MDAQKTEGKNKALGIAVSQLEKQFGRGTLVRLGDDHFVQKTAAVSTGSLGLDIATGVGGLPAGRVIEIFGPESSGKTTLALHVVANAQKEGGIACYIDAEHALDPSFATRIGVDIDNLLVSQPDTAEQALEICETLVRSNAVDVVVIDSVAALVPKAEVEGDMGDSHMGLQARLMSQALRKLTAAISRSNTMVIFINQIREKIGVMFGNPETTTGGRALKFYASIRIDIRRISSIKEQDTDVGNRVRAKVVKNKLAPPFKQAEFDILFAEGISREGDILDLSVADKLIQKSGSWFSMDGENLGQGREATRNYLKNNPELTERLRKQILASRGIEWGPHRTRRNRKTGKLPQNNGNAKPPIPFYSRRTRVGLAVLLVLTLVFAGAALFVKYKLEGLRPIIQQQVEARTGARFTISAVLINGLRGFRVDDVDTTVKVSDSLSVSVKCPSVYIDLDLFGLLSGKLSVNQVRADSASFAIRRIQGTPSQPIALTQPATDLLSPSDSADSLPPLRLVGRNSSISVQVSKDGNRSFELKDFEYDITRLPSQDIIARLKGLPFPDRQDPVQADLTFRSFEDFSLRLAAPTLSAKDIATLVPEAKDLMQTGQFRPTVRVDGYPGRTVFVALDAQLEGITVRGQPDFIQPLSGKLNGVGAYDFLANQVELTYARVQSPQLSGRVEGTVSWETAEPVVNLRVDITQVPFQEVLAYLLKDRAEKYGALDFQLKEPYQFIVTAQGPFSNLSFAVQGSAQSGSFKFEPGDPSLPRGELQLGAISVKWSPETTTPTASFSISDGTLSHAATGLKAEKLSGTLVLDRNRLALTPLNATIQGAPVTGSLAYDIETRNMDFSANGTVGSEKLPIAALSKEASLSGPVNIQCSGSKSSEKLEVDATVDLTMADTQVAWWLHKPAGVGAVVEKAHLVFTPNRAIELQGKLRMEESIADFTCSWAWKKKWNMTRVVASTPLLNIPNAGKFLSIPYRLGGGSVRDVSFQWKPVGDRPTDWLMETSGQFDECLLMGQGTNVPLTAKEGEVHLTMSGPTNRTAELSLKVREAKLPPLKEKWFVAMKSPEVREKYPSVETKWTFHFSGANVDLPPWSGKGFTGELIDTDKQVNFKSFSAELTTGGSIQGYYVSDKAENSYETDLNWKGIQASLLLDQQLSLPKVLNGASTGTAHYFLDRDDPNTLKGSGKVAVENGQFSADYIMTRLEGKLESKISALPPSLKFSELKMDLDFAGDTFRTPTLELASPGIQIAGTGQFVLRGDMDYDLRVNFSPEMANRIPAIRDNFNLQGMKLAGKNVELAFKVKGPTFNPQGELSAMPPVMVTLVSSALERTSEALNIIDIPRKVLVDLLKIGGGIVGVSK